MGQFFGKASDDELDFSQSDVESQFVTRTQPPEVISFIEYFHRIDVHRVMLTVNPDFIQDRFNLFSIGDNIDARGYNLDDIMVIVQGVAEARVFEQMYHSVDDEPKISLAMIIYGMIHSRYIATPEGQKKMLQRINNREYGSCSRVMCEHNPLIPTALTDVPSLHCTLLYCSSCRELYYPDEKSPLSHVDGAFFGSTFPHALLMSVTPEEINCRIPQFGEPSRAFEPRCYGFKVYRGNTAKLNPSRLRKYIEPRQRVVEDNSNKNNNSINSNINEVQQHHNHMSSSNGIGSSTTTSSAIAINNNNENNGQGELETIQQSQNYYHNQQRQQHQQQQELPAMYQHEQAHGMNISYNETQEAGQYVSPHEQRHGHQETEETQFSQHQHEQHFNEGHHDTTHPDEIQIHMD